MFCPPTISLLPFMLPPWRLVRLQQVVARRMWRSSPCWAPAEPMPWKIPWNVMENLHCVHVLIEIKGQTFVACHDDADVMMNHGDES